MNSTTTSNMSASIQKAIFENNVGTRFVRQCQYDSAVKSFTSVLKILKPLAEGGDDNDNVTNAKESTDYDDAGISTVPLIISFQNKSMDTKNTNDNDTTTTPSRTSSSLASSSSSSSPSSASSSSSQIKLNERD